MSGPTRRAQRAIAVDATGSGVFRAWLTPTDNAEADVRAARRAIRREIFEREGTYGDVLATFYPSLRVRYLGTYDGRALYSESDTE